MNNHLLLRKIYCISYIKISSNLPLVLQEQLLAVQESILLALTPKHHHDDALLPEHPENCGQTWTRHWGVPGLQPRAILLLPQQSVGVPPGHCSVRGELGVLDLALVDLLGGNLRKNTAFEEPG